MKIIVSLVTALLMVFSSIVVNAGEEYVEKDGIKYTQHVSGVYFVLLDDCPRGPTTIHQVASREFKNLKIFAVAECEIHHGRAKNMEYIEKDGVKYRTEYLFPVTGGVITNYRVLLPDCPEGPDTEHLLNSGAFGSLKDEAEWQCSNNHRSTQKFENDANYDHPSIDWSYSDIMMAVDGNEITFPDQKPLLDAQAGRTYIPIRFLAESLGADVDWNNDYQVVKIVNKGIEGENTNNVYYLKIGSNKIIQARYSNDGNIADSVSVFYMPENIRPVLEGSRTLIPFRYIAELMGSQVYYDETSGIAHCIKRDATQYSDNMSYGSLPVFNSLIGEFFIDELNKYRAIYGRKPVTLNGDYSDMMTWACFDQITNPGQWEYYQKDHKGVELHLFSWNRNTEPKNDVTLFTAGSEDARKFNVWHYGAYYQYVKTYLPNHPVYGKEMKNETHGYGQDYKLEHWENSYKENAFVSSPLVEGHSVKNLDLSAEIYDELTKYWGLEVKKWENVTIDENFNLIPGPKNGEYITVHIYNENSYREMAIDAITNWANSSGHKQAMISPYATKVGFATVGNFTYMCSTNS